MILTHTYVKRSVRSAKLTVISDGLLDFPSITSQLLLTLLIFNAILVYISVRKLVYRIHLMKSEQMNALMFLRTIGAVPRTQNVHYYSIYDSYLY